MQSLMSCLSRIEGELFFAIEMRQADIDLTAILATVMRQAYTMLEQAPLRATLTR